MKIKVTFTDELKYFYSGFSEDYEETFSPQFNEITTRYVGELEEYSGPYNVTPSLEHQTLYTEQKALMDNIKVFAIPYAEVSNTSGGITATIGGL